MKPLKLALLLSLTLGLQSCAAFVVGGATTVANIATDPRRTGIQLDDQTTEFEIIRTLERNPQLKQDSSITPVVYSGRALLIGTVPTQELKDLAYRLTQSVKNVTGIYNYIQVSPRVSLSQATKDTWITSEIKSKYLLDAKVQSTRIKVITEDGVVYLLGIVTPEQGQIAAQIASRIDGVKKVVTIFMSNQTN